MRCDDGDVSGFRVVVEWGVLLYCKVQDFFLVGSCRSGKAANVRCLYLVFIYAVILGRHYSTGSTEGVFHNLRGAATMDGTGL